MSSDAPMARSANRWLLGHAAIVDALCARIGRGGRMPAALDIACGAGGTLLWLAQRGWQVTGVDISEEALNLVQDRFLAGDLAGRGTFLCTDLDHWRPAPRGFDLVTSFYFLDRALWPAVRETVRPGGLLALQTYNQDRLVSRPGANPVFLLDAGELEVLVQGWGWEILDACSLPAPQATDAVLARRPSGDSPAVSPKGSTHC